MECVSISQNRGTTVIRRYSDYIWLNDYLHKRYPFRLIAPVPAKRLAVSGHHAFADQQFLERRRRGLTRYSEAVLNHPVFKIDPVVQTFFTEPSVDKLRNGVTKAVEEEVSSRTLSPSEEMSVRRLFPLLFRFQMSI